MKETRVLGQPIPVAVYDACLGLFDGNLASAINWLTSPVKALDGARPIDVAQTEFGAAEVLYLVARLRQGIFP